MSLREVSFYQDYVTYHNSTDYDDWDADMIHGCVCDPGYEGLACEKISCPKGDDPMTHGVDEVQLIDCRCTNCTGGLKLTFKGKTTPTIPYDASNSLVKYHLKVSTNTQLTTISSHTRVVRTYTQFFIFGYCIYSLSESRLTCLFTFPQHLSVIEELNVDIVHGVGLCSDTGSVTKVITDYSLCCCVIMYFY
jgi:hypothetical protein